ncbi:unnamed protein product [Wickerhamomyces anomalus]
MGGNDDDAEYLRQIEIQRRNFEAQFGSIEEMGYEDKTKVSDTESLSSDDDDDDEESDSDDELISGMVKLHHYSQKSKPTIEKPKTKEDKENFDNDLELQRFLNESHILSNFKNKESGADLTLQTLDHEEPIGAANRHILQSRLQKLSSVNGVAKKNLTKMPMSIRKGMVKNRIEKIAKFEKDAKEGDIILSKVKKGELRDIGGSVSISERIGTGLKNNKKLKHRDRGLKIQSVGKSTRNGLIISQREIDRINGTGGGRGKGRGKGRGGRR